MALELTGDAIIGRHAGLGIEDITSDSVMESQAVTVEGEGISDMPIPVDISQNANEVSKGEDQANSDFLKDAREVWPTQQQVHSFYFPKFRSFEDAKLKAKVEEAQKDIQKKTNARLQIIEKLKAKRSERAHVISELKPLSIKDKEYRSTMGMKRKEMEPLQAALGELRSANNAAREKGMGLCSSIEELNDTIRSLNYRIQHESLTLNEEKQLIKEIKQLEGTREKVIANESTRTKIQDSLGQKEAIRGQVKLITGDIDEVRKEQLSVRTEIKALESKLETIDDAISSLQKELDTLAQKKNNAYDILNELRQSNNEVNANYFENRSLLNNAKVLAAKKDLPSLQELHNIEIENFMSKWSSSSSIFREDYEKRILTSLDIRQLSRDGRMRNPDEKPIIVKAPLSKEPEAAPAKVVKQAKETLQPHPQHDVVPPKAKDDHLKKSKVVEAAGKTVNSEDIPNAPVPKKKPMKEPSKSDENDATELTKHEGPEKKSSKLDEIDEEKLKEIRREEQVAKAKLALERKKKQAEKAAIKSAARAEKEAEKKLKEKEKKARKKAGEPIAPISAEETDSSAIVTEQEEANENTEVVNVPVVEKSKELKDKLRIRNRPRGRDSVPKVMLKKKKANSYWIWSGPVAVAVAALVLLGYYYFLMK